MPEQTDQGAETPSTQEPSASAIGESRQGEVAQESADSAGNEAQKDQPNGQKPKELSRYERTKRQRAELARREAVLAQRESQFAQRERAAAEAAKPKRDYTLNDLRKFRPQWARELQKAEDTADYEAVESLRATVAAADKEIAAMEAEAQAERQSRTLELPPMGSPEHQAQWESAERELAQVDPEFMRNGTRLDKRLREIMGSEDGNIYRQHPRGIVAAYHRAKMELLEGDYKVLQTENSKLKNELQRYTGLTSIGGGAPARIGSSSRVESIEDFSKLSVADMRKHLKRGVQRDGVPWF
jgi:hypothetical protein